MTPWFGLGQVPQQGPPPLPNPEIPAPLPVDLGWPWWAWLGLALLITLVLGLLLRLLMGRSAGPTPLPKRPLQEALKALKDLRNRAPALPPADVGYTVSAILRRYFMDRYGVPAPFQTSEELFPAAPLGNEPQRRRVLRERFESLATLYDSLSYAPLPASTAECLALIETAIVKLEEERLHENSLAA